ncbi:hypothetical protein I3760_08G113100 [Carya illinoinensis]|nr:hypothetical protein I3760_08G113100 [Carya illinoinensis]
MSSSGRLDFPMSVRGDLGASHAKCNQDERKDLWDHLCSILGVGVPWMVLGDFNIIRVDDERIGGRPRPFSAMEEFNGCINRCGLIDFRLHERQMSWCNGQSGLARSWAKLDSVLVNNLFLSKFGDALAKLLSKQFDAFNDNSFSENTELCGTPLSKKCENLDHDSMSPPPNHSSEFLFEFGWKVVTIGYGCGFVFGVVYGQIVITKKYDWFTKTFAIGQPT